LNTQNLVSTGFGLAAVLSWGCADFLGGYAAKSTDPFLLTTIAHAAGLVLVGSIALLQHAPYPSHAAVIWSLAGGISGGVCLAIFYRSLAAGQMGLNGPTAALIGASIPVAVGFATQGFPHPIQIAGFVLAAIGIFLVSKPDRISGRPAGLGLAVIAGLGFAGFFLFLKQAGDSSAIWVATLTRLSSVVVVGAIALAKYLRQSLQNRLAWVGIIAGLLDVSGTYCFVRASQTGRLDVSVVLSSLYPVITVVLARLILKERLTPLKATGMAAAIVAMPLIVLK